MADLFAASPYDRDFMARTMMAEDSSDDGMTGVGNVIANRVLAGRYGGSDPTSVVMAPNQFEPWSTRSTEMMNYDPQSPQYQKAMGIVNGIISGQIPDTTGGSTHFFAPDVMADRGQSSPKWAARGGGITIGDQMYFAPEGRVVRNQPKAAAGAGVPPTPSPDTSASPAGDPDGEALLNQFLGKAPTLSSAPAGTSQAAAAPADVADPEGEALLKQFVTPAAPSPSAAPKIAFVDPNNPIPLKPISALDSAAAPAAAPGPLANAAGDSTVSSIAKNVATGAIKGAADVPGFAGNIGNLADYLVARGDHLFTGTPTDQTMASLQAARQPAPGDSFLHRLVKMTDPRNLLPSGQDISNPVLAQTGQYVPTTLAGRALQAGVETAAGSLAPGALGSRAVNMLSGQTLAGAGAVGAMGQYASDATGDPLAGLAAAAVPGAVLGAGTGLANRLLGTVEPETARLAQMARDQYGIPVNAGQISDSPSVRFAASASGKMPFSGAGNAAADQQTAFNRAVSNTFGQPADKITPDVMAAAKDRIGQSMSDVAAQTTIKADPQFASDLTNTFRDAQSVLPDTEIKPLRAQLSNVLSTIDPQTGIMSGESYQALTRKGAPLDRAMNSGDPNVKFYAGQIRDAIDDAMQRSASPELVTQLSQARSQYKNMKTIEDLVEKSPTGDISPDLLMGATRQSFGNIAYGGGGQLGDLSRIGKKFLKEPPSSGTAERNSFYNLLTKIGGTAAGLAGAGGAYASSLPLDAQLASGAAIPASMVLNRLTGGYLRSPSVTQGLIDRSLGTPSGPGLPQQVNQLMLAPYLGHAGASIRVPPRKTSPQAP